MVSPQYGIISHILHSISLKNSCKKFLNYTKAQFKNKNWSQYKILAFKCVWNHHQKLCRKLGSTEKISEILRLASQYQTMKRLECRLGCCSEVTNKKTQSPSCGFAMIVSTLHITHSQTIQRNRNCAADDLLPLNYAHMIFC